MNPLNQTVQKNGRALRLGYTTGSCAAGAACAAAHMLLGGAAVESVRIDTPAGISLELDIEDIHIRPDLVRCAVRKDAGDDPDVTDGLLVYAAISRLDADIGIEITGGEGVGLVTRPGLARAPGEPAINPVPLDMIRAAVREATAAHRYTGGLRVEILVPGGQAVAARTFNPRLGIEGGISILGTTGIVEPMSERALLDTIALELRMRRAAGQQTLLLTPGNYGREFAAARLGLELDAGVKCSNFIGDALDLAAAEGFGDILLLGHAGKLVKLAAGVMNTHSRVADARMEVLCTHAALAGADRDLLRGLFGCVSVDAADALLLEAGIAERVWTGIAAQADKHLRRRLADRAAIAFGAFAARGMVMRSPRFGAMLQKLGGRLPDS